MHALEHFVEGAVKVAMPCDAATKDRFEISEISDVDDLIDAMHECAHQIPGMIQVGTVHARWGRCASIAIIFSTMFTRDFTRPADNAEHHNGR